MQEIKENIAKKIILIPIVIFVVFTSWLLILIQRGVDPLDFNAQVWSATYQIIAWFGALYGMYYARLWGGWRSLMGRANIAFAVGLLLQSFGQSVFSYHFFQGTETLYPSIADIGFFGSIPLYIYGIVLLAKASGVHFSFKSVSNRMQVFLIPAIMLVLSYLIFLKDYAFDWSEPLTVFLDFGYPLGQAVYISIAIVTYLLSRNFLGGVMKKPILYFIFALVIQYIADYIFLYQISRETYTGGQGVDFLYLISYFVMTLSLIKLGSVFYKIKNS